MPLLSGTKPKWIGDRVILMEGSFKKWKYTRGISKINHIVGSADDYKRKQVSVKIKAAKL